MLDAKRPVQSTMDSSSNLSYNDKIKKINKLKKNAEIREKRLLKEQEAAEAKRKQEELKKQQEQERLAKVAERELAKYNKSIEYQEKKIQEHDLKQAEKNDKKKAKREARELKKEQMELELQRANEIIIEKQQRKELERKRKLEEANKRKEEKKSSRLGRKSLKIYRTKKSLLIFALIATTGFCTYKSGYFQTKYADYKNRELLEQAQEDLKEDVLIPEIKVVEKKEEPKVEIKVEEVEEEVIEKHETISTELYDSGYEFNEDITAEYLKSINPAGSNNTSWIEIPGTKISYPVVHPSTDSIDQVEGLRTDIEKSGQEEAVYMNNYFLNKNLTGNYSTAGTIYEDLYNSNLNGHSEDLSDITNIYGHNMKNGSMFKGLMNWKYDKNGSYNEQHPFGIIYTDDGYGYQVTFIASRIIPGDTSVDLHYNNFNSFDEKQQYISSIMEDAKKNGWFALDGYEVQEDDKYIFLTTCTYEHLNDRFQLIGVMKKIKINDLVNDDYYVEERSALNR